MKRTILVCLLLCLVILVPYWQVRDYSFINYDDPSYVSENSHVRSGVSPSNAAWSFTIGYSANWHPLTWLSHMLDCSLFGLAPGAHHLVNVCLHLLATLALFLLLLAMTGAVWRSAFVAALFAVHPMHVESVAWIAERKDMLSGLFFMLTIASYLWYVRRKGPGRHLFMCALFALGLMAKPMLVTLPLVLLLLDFWPLRRLGGEARTAPAYLLAEKLPLALLSALSCAITLIAQHNASAIARYPLALRVANAIISYAAYLWKMVVPVDLTVFYPYRELLPWRSLLAAILVLASITAASVKFARRKPWFLTGWLWYLVMLVPVIGIVQVGDQALADRYSYLPSIGIFIMAAWGSAELCARFRFGRIALASCGVAIVLAAMLLTWRQVGYWKDSATLFEHALKVNPRNYVAHNNLGLILAGEGRLDSAISHYYAALRENPADEKTLNNLGNVLAGQGKLDEAIERYRAALREKPDFGEAHSDLAVALANQGKLDEAIAHFKEALRLFPDDDKPHNNLGFALAQQGKLDEAIPHYEKALRLNPSNAIARCNLAFALAKTGKTDSAIAQYQMVIRADSKNAEARNNLGTLLFGAGRIGEAIAQFEEALRLQPDFKEAASNLEAAKQAVAKQ